MVKLTEFNDQDSQMDLHDLTFSETSLDQFPDLPMSSPAPSSSSALFCSGCDICSKSECLVEKIKKRKGIGHGTSTRIIRGKTFKKGKKGRRDKKQMLNKRAWQSLRRGCQEILEEAAVQTIDAQKTNTTS